MEVSAGCRKPRMEVSTITYCRKHLTCTQQASLLNRVLTCRHPAPVHAAPSKLDKPGKQHLPIHPCPRTALGASSTRICCGSRGKHLHAGTAWTANTVKPGTQDIAGRNSCMHGKHCCLHRSHMDGQPSTSGGIHADLLMPGRC